SAVPASPKPKPSRPVESRPAVDPRSASASGPALEAATKSVEAFLQRSSSSLKFGVDQETGSYTFKIIDPVTQETIRQVPSEEILEMARRLRALDNPKDASGILMDEEG
ncbi:MAG TPA: flagellar protein FlaG, partial [Geothrix sp.]|nr:flagellar protein FlaG [Geothrix sp.]